MTLVVGRITPFGVRLAGDMRVTRQEAAHPSGYERAQLKLILVRPTLCLAYAGDIATALAAIRETVLRGFDARAARDFLVAVNQRQPIADYLVGSVHPSMLHVIRDGRANECTSAWLGDHEAFSAYQEAYHQDLLLPPEDFYDVPARRQDIEVALRMSHAMHALVHGPQAVGTFDDAAHENRGAMVSTVGEAVITVVPRVEDGLLRYGDMNRAESSPFVDPLPPKLGVVPPDWGSAERGAFSFSMLTPRNPGVGAVGIYFHEGRLGILYAPLITNEPARVPNVSPRAFVEVVRLRYGIELGGFIS